MTGAETDRRNYKGYGENPPHANWPGGARIAVQFVLNYEEGGENCVLNGDAGAEIFLSEIINAPKVQDRHMSMESLYEYGSRAGVWRVLRLFKKYNIHATIFAVAMAIEKYPEMAQVFLREGHEICSHGYRWIDYQNVDIETERLHMRKAVEILTAATGQRPLGWYTGRTSPHTRQLVMEEGGFLYDADDYNDDLPFWVTAEGKQQLIVPYTLDTNDMRFCAAQGFNAGDQYYTYLRDAFDTLYAEGDVAPKMLSIGLHCRIIGRPARIAALEKFIQHIKQHEKVWICKRIDIAQHWIKHHPYQGESA